MFCVREPAPPLPEAQFLLYCTIYINIMMYGVGQVIETLRYKS